MIILKGTTFIFVFLISTVCFCQSQGNALSKENYFKKSKNQKSVTTILLSAAAVSTVTAFIYGLSGDGGIFGKGSEKGGIFVGIALACVTVAIPFKIASKRNQRKALALSANIMFPNVRFQKQSGIFAQACPGLTLKFHL